MCFRLGNVFGLVCLLGCKMFQNFKPCKDAISQVCFVRAGICGQRAVVILVKQIAVLLGKSATFPVATPCILFSTSAHACPLLVRGFVLPRDSFVVRGV